VKRYHNQGREHALSLLLTGRYDDLADLLRDSVVFKRRWYDQHYEWLQNHGIGKMYREEDATS